MVAAAPGDLRPVALSVIRGAAQAAAGLGRALITGLGVRSASSDAAPVRGDASQPPARIAGNEVFADALVERYAGTLAAAAGLTVRALLVPLTAPAEAVSVTVPAVRRRA